MHFILLRGLARETAHWLDFPSTLGQQLGSNCRVHCVDFPGCGKYHQQPALDSVTTMTEHARAEFAHLITNSNKEPIYLLGISMGGMVALDWAQRFPEELSGVVLINASAGNQPFWWRLRPGAWLTMAVALLLPAKQREAMVLRKVSNCQDDFQQRLQQWLAIQQQHPVSRATILTMLAAAARFVPPVTAFRKGLIIGCQQDQLVSIKASKALAQRCHWPVRIHPSAGHDLPMDDAHWLAQQVKFWLASPSTDSREDRVKPRE